MSSSLRSARRARLGGAVWILGILLAASAARGQEALPPVAEPTDPGVPAPFLDVTMSDGRAPRRDTLTVRDGEYGPLDRLTWELMGSLSLDPGGLRARMTWADSLEVALAVGSRVVHAGEKAFTMDRPISLSSDGLLYPFPEFLHVVAAVDPRGVVVDGAARSLAVRRRGPRMRSLVQREIGHRFELRCRLDAKPVARLHWNGYGSLRVELEGIFEAPPHKPIEPGNYARVVEIRPTSRGQEILLEVGPAVEGWVSSWESADSVWVLGLSASPREVSRLALSPLVWKPEASPSGRRGPIVVELDVHRRADTESRRYLESLSDQVAGLLRGRLDVPVDVRYISRSGATSDVESANAEGTSLYLSLSLDAYGGGVPPGLTAAILPRARFKTLAAGDGPGLAAADASPGPGPLLPWDEASDRHHDASRYLARLLAAILDDGAVRIEERPMAGLVGLDMPVLRLYVGRQGPSPEPAGAFPGPEEWERLDELSLSVVQAVQEFILASGRGRDL